MSDNPYRRGHVSLNSTNRSDTKRYRESDRHRKVLGEPYRTDDDVEWEGLPQETALPSSILGHRQWDLGEALGLEMISYRNEKKDPRAQSPALQGDNCVEDLSVFQCHPTTIYAQKSSTRRHSRQRKRDSEVNQEQKVHRPEHHSSRGQSRGRSSSFPNQTSERTRSKSSPPHRSRRTKEDSGVYQEREADVPKRRPSQRRERRESSSSPMQTKDRARAKGSGHHDHRRQTTQYTGEEQQRHFSYDLDGDRETRANRYRQTSNRSSRPNASFSRSYSNGNDASDADAMYESPRQMDEDINTWSYDTVRPTNSQHPASRAQSKEKQKAYYSSDSEDPSLSGDTFDDDIESINEGLRNIAKPHVSSRSDGSDFGRAPPTTGSSKTKNEIFNLFGDELKSEQLRDQVLKVIEQVYPGEKWEVECDINKHAEFEDLICRPLFALIRGIDEANSRLSEKKYSKERDTYEDRAETGQYVLTMFKKWLRECETRISGDKASLADVGFEGRARYLRAIFYSDARYKTIKGVLEWCQDNFSYLSSVCSEDKWFFEKEDLQKWISILHDREIRKQQRSLGLSSGR
ncbi:hypothetical protein GGR57DRAFT_501632 [Xylariaceae sp. FL1272]|nr:hypothetical protein GGR57DRAFT_501632 [Xylariaceae sp. FL1272]